MSTTSKTFLVYGNKFWQNTGIQISPNDHVEVFYRHGSWTCNPGHGYYDSGGINIIAKPGYAMQGVNEGALIGKVGSRVFHIGKQAFVPEDVDGTLELIINDDLASNYGAGYRDNRGAVEVDLIVYAENASEEDE